MRGCLAFLFCLAATCPLVARAADAAGVVDIGSRRELFVDRLLIDRMVGTELRLHRPVDEGSVLAFDRPWEGPFSGYATVIRAGEKYQLYYRGFVGGGGDTDESQVTCYAESTDGIAWTKPALALYPRGEHKTTNIVLADAAPVTHNFSPFLDTRAGVKGDERYKAVGGYHHAGLIAYASPDGLRWRKLRDEPVLTRERAGLGDGSKSLVFDSQNVAFWSEAEGKYLLYYRIYKDRKRRIARVESDDFLTWTSPALMEYRRADEAAPVEELYTNQTHPYFRGSHLYVATAARFMLGRRVLTTQQAEAIRVNPKYFNDTSDAIFMTSRGGNVYDRTFMEAFVAPGIGAENWVSRTNYPALNVVQTGPTEMSVYVNQNYGQPTAHLRRYSMRLDGFASVRAGYDRGEMVTKPLKFEGSRLLLNFATSAAGGIRVEVQDEAAAPVPGFALHDCQEVIGNEIERAVGWKGGNLNEFAGKVVRLRFVMKDADLYALRFAARQERETLMGLLRSGLVRHGTWTSVRAGEALVTFGASRPVLEAFEPQSNTATLMYRIGVWRVLARAQADSERRRHYVERIRNVLLDEQATDRVHAVESLAKLGEPIATDQERRVVEQLAKEPAAAPFALWRLAQAGDASAVDRLLACLRGGDAIGRNRAAYVLVRLPAARAAAKPALSAALAAEPADSPAYPAIAAAVGGEALRTLAKNAASAPTRYAAAMELAERGDAEDRELLEELIDDDDDDVRVAAAFALLRIDDRVTSAASRPTD